jgi:hypothetical protein
MKRIFLILPLLLPLTGCIVYSPSPTSGQYGYTYDYSLPIAEGVPARIPEQAIVATEVDPVSPPPRVPPIYSEIPDASPERPEPAAATRTVIVPSGPPVIQESAGAEVTRPAAVPTVIPQTPPAYPSVGVAGGGLPFVISTNTNQTGTNVTGVITNTNNTVGVITNTNNTVGVITNTNTLGAANTNSPFAPLPDPNANEAAGAERDIPNRLPPAPRLPAAPQLEQAPSLPDPNSQPVSSPTPTSPLPQQNPLPQQIQQQQQQTAPPATPPPQPAQPFTPPAPTSPP